MSIAVEGGQTIPEEIAGRLAEFGIIVPKISETAENTAEIGENLTESVPNTPENANIDSEPAAMDNKHIEVEDMQEVNLDADDKTPVSDDTKDVSEDDAKEAAPAKRHPSDLKNQSKDAYRLFLFHQRSEAYLKR